jgi:DNA primase catalytic core
MTTFRDFREEVRARSDLLAIIEQTVAVQHRSSRTTKVLCPFHHEDTPSLAIYMDQQRWYCFGSCKEGGDVFGWVEKRDGVDHRTAVEMLARDAGMEIPKWHAESEEEKADRLQAEELLDLAAKWYHEKLLAEPGAQAHRDYLQTRGFDRGFWEHWQLGAAGTNNGLLAYLRSKGADIALAQTVGLIGAKEDRLFDWFSNRIVIPFIEDGKAVFLTGRAIADQKPKYLHLSNSEFAHKVAYNAKRMRKNVVVVEGPLDVWAVEALARDDVSAVALCGLGFSDPALQKSLKRSQTVYVGLDSDGTVKREIIEGLVGVVGVQRAKLLAWPSGDDAAAWWKQSATSDEFYGLLSTAQTWPSVLVQAVKDAPENEKSPAVERAIKVAANMTPAEGDEMAAAIKAAARGAIQASTINKILKDARKANQESYDRANTDGDRDQDVQSYYYVREGELWRGYAEDARRILAGGTARYIQMVHVDDGEEKDLELELEIELRGGRILTTRVPSEYSNEPGKVASYMKKVAGPLITIEAKQGPYLVTAIEMLSREGIQERIEIAHTGWITTDAGLAYVTPGGVVGKLPDGYSVALPKGLERFRVNDEGDEAFQQGLDGIANGLLKAFERSITYPALAFALLPVAARWMGSHKFAMHLSGETGSLKTETSKVLMSFYGDFSDAPPLTSWRSTVNSIEHLGFWLPDCLGMVDDYKPRIVKLWDFVELIQRYADRNDRLRLSRDAQLRRRQAMRWWLLSTGEDLPSGESSVLARMVNLRFPRRPQGVAYNADLGKAQRLAKFFPTVTARFAKWLMDNAGDAGFGSRILLHHELLAEKLQDSAPDAPNVNRISRNVAVLWTVWEVWWDFVIDQPMISQKSKKQCREYAGEFLQIAISLALSMARQVVEEKPTRVFLDALQEGLDGGRFKLLLKTDSAEAQPNTAGWFDDKGIYLLPAMYNEIARWLRESGQQIGFTKQELYRLLDEEGLLAQQGDDAKTIVIQVGPPGSIKPKRVLALKPGVLAAPSVPKIVPVDL